MSEESLLDLGFLTEEERDIIHSVIFKDAEIRKQEQSRISVLRKELDELREAGLPEHQIESKNEQYCARCQTYFGIILNKGALCPRCNLKVCKTCRKNVAEAGWMCTLCSKVREVKAQSGAWFFQGYKEKSGNLFGSMLVRKSLRRLPSTQSLQEEKRNKHSVLSNTDLANHDQPHQDNYGYATKNHVQSQHKSSDHGSHQGILNGGRQVEYFDSDVDSDDSDHDDHHSAGTGSERSHSKEDLKLQHEEPDVEPKSDEKSSSSEADKYEASPGNEHVSLVGYGDENAEMAANPPTGDPQGELEVPQEPHDYLSNVYQDDEKETEEIDRKPEPSEASPTAEDLSLSMRENALLAFSETFSSVHTSKSSFPRGDPAGSRESNDEGDRRLSDPRTDDHDVFNPDNESSFTETSGYVTPTASEDASSKQTPSISGDDGSRRSKEDYGQHELEQAPIIVTTDADDAPRSNHPPIDFEEDLEVSFSKYGTGLGNRKLKDQLSMGSRESIVSYYSNAGGEVYGKYPVTGEIYFGMKYDAIQQEFQVQIHQAKEITPVDEKNNVSDPYVKTYLLPDRSRGGKRKTKVKKNTINPVYDEILSYKISYDEILQRTLWVAIWNHDRFGHNDFLGEVLVPIDVYQQSGFSLEDPEPQWYTLCERQAEDPDLLSNGEIVIALKYVPPSAVVSKKKKKKKKGEEEKGELHINIIEATNLIAKDSNGFSDPFCKSYLLPDKSKKTKQKTAVVKKSLNPKWNYHFVYDNVTHMDLMDRVLELTVWDFDRGSSNDFLGGVRLGLGAGIKEWDDANSEEQAAWNKMLNNHNDWNQVTLVLRDNMGNHK